MIEIDSMSKNMADSCRTILTYPTKKMKKKREKYRETSFKITERNCGNGWGKT